MRGRFKNWGGETHKKAQFLTFLGQISGKIGENLEKQGERSPPLPHSGPEFKKRFKNLHTPLICFLSLNDLHTPLNTFFNDPFFATSTLHLLMSKIMTHRVECGGIFFSERGVDQTLVEPTLDEL